MGINESLHAHFFKTEDKIEIKGIIVGYFSIYVLKYGLLFFKFGFRSVIGLSISGSGWVWDCSQA